MKYVGLYTQQRRNNTRSFLLLALFPIIIVGLIALFCYILAYMQTADEYGATAYTTPLFTNLFTEIAPWGIGIVGVWFLIAYFANTSMIANATGARPLQRRENPRVYNIVENLTMSCGMKMPQVNVIDTPMLNAFASGINDKTYTVTVTTGLCNLLNDDELTGVIAHELTHIRNRDTRLLIVSIVFVGIMSTLTAIALRMMWHTFLWGGAGSRNDRDNNKNGGVAVIVMMLLAVVLTIIGYFFTMLTRFAISRKREYMADAGGAEMCGNPLALASALEKISSRPYTTDNGREDVQQLFIIHPQALSSGDISGWINNLFSTHPSTESRIKFLRSL
ncbi:MAG: M48 family metallopeptidase [Bacteroidaceae bacterium]|nr:M48 family metallopeptidase [Bacteroidaceae bacterium]